MSAWLANITSRAKGLWSIRKYAWRQHNLCSLHVQVVLARLDRLRKVKSCYLVRKSELHNISEMCLRLLTRCSAHTGLMEITRLYEMCAASASVHRATGGGKWLVPLHSTLSSSEQQSVFELPPDGAQFIGTCMLEHVAWALTWFLVSFSAYTYTSCSFVLLE